MNKFFVEIVEDKAESLSVLVEIVGREFGVRAATNGELALKVAEQKPHPDLILLDLFLPDSDGFTVCMKLKENPETAKIPVIFLSASDDEIQKKKGLEVGAAEFITKPYDQEYLMKVIRKYARKKGIFTRPGHR